MNADRRAEAERQALIEPFFLLRRARRETLARSEDILSLLFAENRKRDEITHEDREREVARNRRKGAKERRRERTARCGVRKDVEKILDEGETERDKGRERRAARVTRKPFAPIELE